LQHDIKTLPTFLSQIFDYGNTAMSTQALGSEVVREGLKDVLLGPARLYEALREQAGGGKVDEA
jgi:hypothetical protein